MLRTVDASIEALNKQFDHDIAAAEWELVRCPQCQMPLGEVGGDDGRLRRICGRCRPKVVITYERATRTMTIEVLRPDVLTAAGVPAIL